MERGWGVLVVLAAFVLCSTAGIFVATCALRPTDARHDARGAAEPA